MQLLQYVSLRTKIFLTLKTKVPVFFIQPTIQPTSLNTISTPIIQADATERGLKAECNPLACNTSCFLPIQGTATGPSISHPSQEPSATLSPFHRHLVARESQILVGSLQIPVIRPLTYHWLAEHAQEQTAQPGRVLGRGLADSAARHFLHWLMGERHVV